MSQTKRILEILLKGNNNFFKRYPTNLKKGVISNSRGGHFAKKICIYE